MFYWNCFQHSGFSPCFNLIFGYLPWEYCRLTTIASQNFSVTFLKLLTLASQSSVMWDSLHFIKTRCDMKLSRGFHCTCWPPCSYRECVWWRNNVWLWCHNIGLSGLATHPKCWTMAFGGADKEFICDKRNFRKGDTPKGIVGFIFISLMLQEL